MRKRVLKKKYRILANKLRKIIVILLFLFFIIAIYKRVFKNNYVSDIDINNNIVTVTLNKSDLFCMLNEDKPDENDNWIESKDKTCTLDYKDNMNLYIKNGKKIVDYNKTYIKVSDKEIYVPVNGTVKINKYQIGKNIELKDYNGNIKVSKDLIITGKKKGKSLLTVKTVNDEYSIKITVTDLIINRVKEYDKNKEYLTCNKYTEEENELLDNILKNRINNAGYKTRAGVVEAARFLVLDFPYKINYFYENGRQTTNKVDGEGRYYHEGLYLNKSKYSDLTGSTTLNNKGTWGCSIYCYPGKRNIVNGLDCSGFVSWVLLNGGFDVKDVGAGWSDDLDLTDYGEVQALSSTNTYIDRIKVGDLLHSEKAGGHIGIIIGGDKDYYYIAQALWFDDIGVIITKNKKEELYKEFPHVVLMDKYYQNDGYLTNMW